MGYLCPCLAGMGTLLRRCTIVHHHKCTIVHPVNSDAHIFRSTNTLLCISRRPIPPLTGSASPRIPVCSVPHLFNPCALLCTCLHTASFFFQTKMSWRTMLIIWYSGTSRNQGQ